MHLDGHPGVGAIPNAKTRAAVVGLDSGRSRRMLVAEDGADVAEALALGLRYERFRFTGHWGAAEIAAVGQLVSGRSLLRKQVT